MDRDNKLISIINTVGGLVRLWKGIHDQVDAKEVSGTKMWDISLRTQVNILNWE